MPDNRDQNILTILQKGEIAIQGEFLWGSNYTFSVQITHANTTVQGVYKPTRGERPLWDFPKSTLARREVAAYLVSEALGWSLVPPTVYRRKGPIGPGSVQLFIQHDSEYHYFNFAENDRQRLRPVALFDILINNADRKGSHILIDRNDHMWLIDHGIGFHRDDKLRTVVWDFAGEMIPADLCTSLIEFRQKLQPSSELVTELQAYLTTEEILALAARTDQLIVSKCFPNPHPNRRPYPWPPV
jgi:uncharacterized repeat protein (TIGR03843 family)